jgi:hypothetical protein
MKAMLKPATLGETVRDPDTGALLPRGGGEVEMNSFWRRRLRDGSVVEVKAERKADSKPAEKAGKGEG